MFVYLNAFDYNTLIKGFVERLGLQDEPLTYEMLLRRFENVSNRLKARNQIFTENLVGTSDIIDQLATQYLTWMKNSPHFHDNTNHEKVLTTLFTGPRPQSSWEGYEVYQLLTSDFQEVGTPELGFYLDIDQDEAEKIAALVTQTIQRFENNSVEEDNVESFLEECIRAQLVGDEPGMLELDVIDLPGKIVKYGNVLITFPILLAKVEHHDTI